MSTVTTGNTPGTAVGSSDQDLQAGQDVGEYRIESVLGQGGFGTVYAAVHPLIGKRAAIKVLARKYSADPAVVSRFVAEARAVNQIRHRNIIDIFSFGQLADGRHYYVMEYLEGQPLDAYLRERGPLPLEEALPILKAIARALDAAHAKGIAHRDLKPENIFLAHDTDGETFPKLLDFGIAKLMQPEDDVRHRTGTGVPLGTPYYMSPEQCRGKDVDHRTDVYSFGIVAYRMLTGTFPFEGDDYVELLFKQVNDEAPAPSTRRPDLPASVDTAIGWMMEKERDKRPPTVVEGVHALDPDASRTPSSPSLIAYKTGRGSKPSIPPKRQMTPDALAATTAPDQAPVAFGSAATIAGTSSQLPTGTGPAKLPAAPASGSKTWLFALLGVLVLAGGGVSYMLVRTKDVAKKPDVEVAAQGSAALPAATPIDAAVAAEVVDAAAPTREGTTVIVTIEGAPKGTQVMRNGERIGLAPKVELAYGTKEVPLELHAPGFDPEQLVVTPDDDKKVSVKLTRSKGTHTQQNTEQEPGHDDLADPFKKKQKTKD